MSIAVLGMDYYERFEAWFKAAGYDEQHKDFAWIVWQSAILDNLKYEGELSGTSPR